MSKDWSSEVLGLRSEVSSLREDVSAVKLSQSISSLDNGSTYPAGVDVCVVNDTGYQQSRARSRGVNRIFSLSDGADVKWVIERPTWLNETGSVYSICSNNMCEYFCGNSTIYEVCCGKLEDGMAEPGTFYMGRSGDSITVAFRKTSDESKDLSCYLGEYDTAIAIGSIADGESKPTVFVCGAITPGGGVGGNTDVRLPWSLSYDAQSDSIVAYRPAWKSICVDDAHIVRGTIKTELYTDATTHAEDGYVYATISTHVGSSNPDLGIIICTTSEMCIINCKIGETSYVRIGEVSSSISDGNKSVYVTQKDGALGIISEEIVLHSNNIAYRNGGKYYSISNCSSLSGCGATQEDGLVFASSVNIDYAMSCGASGTVFSHPQIDTTCDALVLAYEPQVRVVPFLWANLKDCDTNGNQQ